MRGSHSLERIETHEWELALFPTVEIGVPIDGLTWLLNVPRFEAVAMAEDGYAVRLMTVDPRAFALHKLWVAGREDRDPLKRPRDRAQARAAADLARRWLGLELDDEALLGLPKAVRGLADALAQ